MQAGVCRYLHPRGGLDDGRVLVIGGTTDDQQLLATTEIFDPQTSEFTPGPVAEGRYQMSGGARVLKDGRVVIAGGGSTVEVLDIVAGTTEIVETFQGRGSFATISAWGLDSLLVLGGYDDRITLRRAFALIDLTGLAAAGE